jgi:hypothetical protein
MIEKLAAARPRVLACMHGSAGPSDHSLFARG